MFPEANRSRSCQYPSARRLEKTCSCRALRATLMPRTWNPCSLRRSTTPAPTPISSIATKEGLCSRIAPATQPASCMVSRWRKVCTRSTCGPRRVRTTLRSEPNRATSTAITTSSSTAPLNPDSLPGSFPGPVPGPVPDPVNERLRPAASMSVRLMRVSSACLGNSPSTRAR